MTSLALLRAARLLSLSFAGLWLVAWAASQFLAFRMTAAAQLAVVLAAGSLRFEWADPTAMLGTRHTVHTVPWRGLQWGQDWASLSTGVGASVQIVNWPIWKLFLIVLIPTALIAYLYRRQRHIEAEHPRLRRMNPWLATLPMLVVAPSVFYLDMHLLPAWMVTRRSDLVPVAFAVAYSFMLLFIGYDFLTWRYLDGTYPYCRQCLYNLTGNTSGRCPECGAEWHKPI